MSPWESLLGSWSVYSLRRLPHWRIWLTLPGNDVTRLLTVMIRYISNVLRYSVANNFKLSCPSWLGIQRTLQFPALLRKPSRIPPVPFLRQWTHPGEIPPCASVTISALPSIGMVSRGNVQTSPEDLAFRDPDAFVASSARPVLERSSTWIR